MPNGNKYIEVKQATKGTEGTKRLINNHRDAIKEIQDELSNMDDLTEGDLTEFIGVRDAQFAVFEWRALYKGDSITGPT